MNICYLGLVCVFIYGLFVFFVLFFFDIPMSFVWLKSNFLCLL